MYVNNLSFNTYNSHTHSISQLADLNHDGGISFKEFCIFQEHFPNAVPWLNLLQSPPHHINATTQKGRPRTATGLSAIPEGTYVYMCVLCVCVCVCVYVFACLGVCVHVVMICLCVCVA